MCNHDRLARLTRVVIALLLAGGSLPWGATVLAQSGEEGGAAPVTVTFTYVEELDPGVEWISAVGLHSRGTVEVDAVSGDISGEAIITSNFEWAGPCDPVEGFCEGPISYFWLDMEITGEDGGWSGMGAGAHDAEGLVFIRMLLAGSGANAGKYVLLDTFVEETETSLTLAGEMITRTQPAGGFHIYFDVCITSIDETGAGTAAGAFIMHGPVEGYTSGAANFTFNAVGITAPTMTVGDVVFTDDDGDELYGAYVSEFIAEGHFHHVGDVMLLGGTGKYEGLYGFGRDAVSVSLVPVDGKCAGAAGHWVGESFGS